MKGSTGERSVGGGGWRGKHGRREERRVNDKREIWRSDRGGGSGEGGREKTSRMTGGEREKK